MIHAREASTVFEFFLSEFIQRLLLTFSSVVLGPKFNSLSNGASFDIDYRMKTRAFPQTTGFFRLFLGSKFSANLFRDLC
jgi:hypothetical protein